MKRIIYCLMLLVAVLIATVQMDARNYVMCVGLSNYPKGVNSLRVSANDALTIQKVFEKNGNSTVSILTNESATRDAVLKKMRQAFANAKSGDAVIFYFSGHGTKQGLACYDGVLSFDRILEIMKASPAQTKVVIADACYSGKMRSTKSWEKAMKKEKVMFFLSSRSQEVSRESYYSNSVFTLYLERGLRGGADFDRNRTITAKEIYDFCHNGVIKATNGKQHPVMWGKFNSETPIITWNKNTKDYDNSEAND